MARKARISEEEQQKWVCVRAWSAVKGYSPYKPSVGGLHNPLIILEHSSSKTSNPMRDLSGVVQKLLFEDDAEEFSAVLLLDCTALLALREEDEEDADIIRDEALLPCFGKRMEKSVVRFLERLQLCSATFVALGPLCQLAIKMVSPVDRALSPQHVKRMVLLHPQLPTAFINDRMSTLSRSNTKDIDLRVVYANETEQQRRDQILRQYFPKIDSIICAGVTRDNLNVLFRIFPGNKEECGCGPENCTDDLSYEYDPERFDSIGRSVFFSEVRFQMDPDTKFHKQVCTDVTAKLHEEQEVVQVTEDITKINVEDCTEHIGGLVLRGNRCLLCRSLSGKWKGMRVPSLEHSFASDVESPVACAIRSVSQFCKIDGETELVTLPQIPPVKIYMPCDRPVIVTLYPLYAVYPPPDGPLEEADIEDEDDLYDWYTFSRAVDALQRVNDEATIVALRSLAFALQAAANASILPVKWGGVFGQEFTGLLESAPLAGTSEERPNSTETSITSTMELVRKIRNMSTGTTADANVPGEGYKRLPVTVFSGFLGAGKTTTLTHILQNRQGLRVALIVNDMGAVNIDAALLQNGGSLKQREESMVELSNGCICCTLREDLLQEVAQLAAEQRFDYLIIESSGISEPLPVAETFTFKDDAGVTLSDLAVLDTMVTVVDGASFMRELQTLESLQSRGWHATPEDQRTIAHLLCDQVEFANVIVLNKCDLIDEEEKGTVLTLLRKLNPNADIIESTRGVVDPSRLLGTKRFSLVEAAAHEEWLKEARVGEHVPETVEYGIHSFTFRSLRPMHPERLHHALDMMAQHQPPFSSLLRAKGFAWLATRSDVQAVFAHAGQSCTLVPGPLWWATIGRDQWPEGLAEAIEPLWHDPYGDRQQELVMIGQNMDVDAVKAALEKCVLTDEEFGAGEISWSSYTDPFKEDWASLEEELAQQAHQHSHDEHSHE